MRERARYGKSVNAIVMAAALVAGMVLSGLGSPSMANAADEETRYRETLYNNFIAMAFNASCQILTKREEDALMNNVSIIARDFRDLFGFNQKQWDDLILNLEQDYEQEGLGCDNTYARSFTKSVAQDIVSLQGQEQ